MCDYSLHEVKTRPAKVGDKLVTRDFGGGPSAQRPIEHNADLLFGRVVLPGCPPDVADKRLGRRWGGVGFLSHLRSVRATMSQKSSVPQAVSFVSQVLKWDNR